MNLVFMNSLEKKVADNRVKTGQVSICEQEGRWLIFWNEPQEDGEAAQISWFEGTEWEEMLKVFREKLAEKRSAGYIPLIEGYYDRSEHTSGRTRWAQMMQYYSELHANEKLHQQLKVWRKEKAAAENKLSYMVATNRVLLMISAFIPQSPEELQQIPGLGENKTNMYGSEIIALTKEANRDKAFPLDWLPQSIDLKSFELWASQQKELKYKAEMERQAAKRSLLEGIASGQSMQNLQQTLSMPRRELLLALEQLDKEGYDVDRLVAEELKEMPDEAREKAWEAFKVKGDRYLKPVMLTIVKEGEMQGEQLNQMYDWLRMLRLKFNKDQVRNSTKVV